MANQSSDSPSKVLIEPQLTFMNLEIFKLELINFAAGKSTRVVQSIKQETDYDAPPPPGLNATPAQITLFNRNDKLFREYERSRLQVCAVLYSSLSPEIRNRVDNDREATRLKEQGLVGSLWGFIRQVVQGVGAGNTMTQFNTLFKFKVQSKATLQQDYRAFRHCVNTIETAYPTDQDKVRLWNDIISHRYVNALLDIPEFKNYIEQQILPFPQWPDCDNMHAAVTTITDNQRQMEDAKHGEISANAALSDRGPCFNCGGPHISRDCMKRPTKCNRCGGYGHLAEFCEQINQFKDKNRVQQRPRESVPGFQPRFQAQQRNVGSTSNFRQSKSQHKPVFHDRNKFRYRHKTNKKHRRVLARLAQSSTDEEPDLNLVYLAELLGYDDEWVEYWEDGLCCMADAISTNSDDSYGYMAENVTSLPTDSSNYYDTESTNMGYWAENNRRNSQWSTEDDDVFPATASRTSRDDHQTSAMTAWDEYPTAMSARLTQPEPTPRSQKQFPSLIAQQSPARGSYRQVGERPDYASLRPTVKPLQTFGNLLDEDTYIKPGRVDKVSYGQNNSRTNTFAPPMSKTSYRSDSYYAPTMPSPKTISNTMMEAYSTYPYDSEVPMQRSAWPMEPEPQPIDISMRSLTRGGSNYTSSKPTFADFDQSGFTNKTPFPMEDFEEDGLITPEKSDNEDDDTSNPNLPQPMAVETTVEAPPPEQKKRRGRPKASESSKNSKNVNDEEGDVSAFQLSCFKVRTQYESDVFIIDTGCIGSHILKDDSMVFNKTTTNSPSVQDFSGNTHAPKCRGTLFNTSQKALVMPSAKVNLLSLEQMFKSGMVHSCITNKTSMVMLDKNKRLILTAHNPGDGSYVCTKLDVEKAFANYGADKPKDTLSYSLVVNSVPLVNVYSALTNGVELTTKNQSEGLTKDLNNYLSAQERRRAVEARDLHNRMSHPSDKVLIRALDNGNIKNTELTSQDVRNALQLLGPCVPCLQGKMRAPPRTDLYVTARSPHR
jgi:hypothetical protein